MESLSLASKYPPIMSKQPHHNQNDQSHTGILITGSLRLTFKRRLQTTQFSTLVKKKGEYINAKHSSCEVGKARKDKVTKPLVHSRGQLYGSPNMDRLQYRRTQ